MTGRTLRLSARRARAIALAAQGFAQRPPAGRVDRRHVRRVLRQVAVFQIDSVNVLVRSHYLPLFSRLGPYPRELLDRMAANPPRELFEYWGHEASLIPVEMYRLFRWRMDRGAMGETWGGMARVARERPEYIETVVDEVAARGPLSAGELSDPGMKRGPWWGWPDGKRALEWLFWTGRLAVAGRRNFERLYDLPERVLPAEVLARPAPGEEEAHRELLRIASRALGVGTAADLADYFRLTVPWARPRIAELVESGDLVPVEVEGWSQGAYLGPRAVIPRKVDARALLSPFDPVMWFRPRVERLFGFHYRIELYTPAAKRTFGYYVVPFLLGDRLVARVDLKADRKPGVLIVHAAGIEADQDPARVAPALAVELERIAAWLGLKTVRPPTRGSLAAPLRRALS